MDVLKKIFPFSFRGKDNASLVVAIVIYLLAPGILGVATGLLGKAIPAIGTILGTITSLVGLYCFVGLILAVLYRVNVID